MENKELNLAIYNQMAEVANEVFETFVKQNIDCGDYSVKDINKDKFFAQMPFWWDSRDESPIMEYLKEKIEFSAGEFVCTVPRCGIFRIMQMWESKLRINPKNKIKLVKEYPGILLLNLLSEIVALSVELAKVGVIGETKPAFYPIATTAKVIDFPAMVESATKEIESDREMSWAILEESLTDEIIESIAQIDAILDTLSLMTKEIPAEPKQSEYNQYNNPEIQTMAYSVESYSGPAYIEFPDNCENWAGIDSEIEWDQPCGTPFESLTESEWDKAEWIEYSAPVNIEIVEKILDLCFMLSSIQVIGEMCHHAEQIENYAGMLEPDKTDTEPIPEVQTESITQNMGSFPEPEIIKSEPPILTEQNNKPRILKRIFLKAREYAALLF